MKHVVALLVACLALSASALMRGRDLKKEKKPSKQKEAKPNKEPKEPEAPAGPVVVEKQWQVLPEAPGQHVISFTYINEGSSATLVDVIVNCKLVGSVVLNPGTSRAQTTVSLGPSTRAQEIRARASNAHDGLQILDETFTITLEQQDPTLPPADDINSCFVLSSPNGPVDYTSLIQGTLSRVRPQGAILLIGDFVLSSTIFFPSDFFWRLHGTVRLADKAVLDNNELDWKSTMITERPGGSTNIHMSGGTYHGNKANNPNTSIRLLNFVLVSQSNFSDMVVEYASDDNFSFGHKASFNEVRNVIARYAGGNGLTDKGWSNKWYNCVAEFSDSDGWTPKSQNSEFYNCIARENDGPGFGLYARTDLEVNNVGAKLNGNKFIGIEAYCNRKAGISFNIASNVGPGAEIINNNVQGLFYKNSHGGVAFRNKQPDGKIIDNYVDMIAIDNTYSGKLEFFGRGLDVEVTGSGYNLANPFRATGFTGYFIGHSAGPLDVNIFNATGSSLTVYQTTPKASTVGKTISLQALTCAGNMSGDTRIKKYCESVNAIKDHHCIRTWN